MSLFATYHGGGIGKGSAYQIQPVASTYQAAYGTLYGTDIAYASSPATVGSTYRVLDSNISSADLLNMTFVNQGELQVSIAGIYEINWAMNINSTVANSSVKCGISVNSGNIHVSGQIGFSVTSTTEYHEMSGTVIKNLSANDRIAICFKVVSSSPAPNINVGDINLTLHRVYTP